MPVKSAHKKRDLDVDIWHMAWHTLQDDVTGHQQLLLAPPQPASLKLELDKELPSYALLHLRTGIVSGTLGATRLDVDASAPHSVLSSHGNSQWLQWKQPAPASLHLAPQTFSDLMHGTQDQAAVQSALNMALQCPAGGVVTLSVRNAQSLSPECPHIFLALRATTSATICIKACALRKCHRACRLEPRLHTDWWNEAEHSSGDPHAKPPEFFASNYDSDDNDDTKQEEQDAAQPRHPLELLATQQFLAQDLLRRAGVQNSALKSPADSLPCAPSRGSPTLSHSQSLMLFKRFGLNMAARNASAPASPVSTKRRNTSMARAVVERVSRSLPQSPLTCMRGAMQQALD